MVIGKTASLFGWAAAAGAWAAGETGQIPAALVRFGEGIGIAFQLVDDALDYAADPGLLGKRLGTDLIEGKATLPLIRACEAEPQLRERLSARGGRPERRRGGRRRGDRRGEAVGGVDAARALAREHTRARSRALEEVPDGVHRRALREAAASLTERAF